MSPPSGAANGSLSSLALGAADRGCPAAEGPWLRTEVRKGGKYEERNELVKISPSSLPLFLFPKTCESRSCQIFSTPPLFPTHYISPEWKMKKGSLFPLPFFSRSAPEGCQDFCLKCGGPWGTTTAAEGGCARKEHTFA